MRRIAATCLLVTGLLLFTAVGALADDYPPAPSDDTADVIVTPTPTPTPAVAARGTNDTAVLASTGGRIFLAAAVGSALLLSGGIAVSVARRRRVQFDSQ